ncbi:MAG: ATP-binding protein [Thermotogota bacterium]
MNLKRIKLKAEMSNFQFFIGFVEDALVSLDLPQKVVFSLMTVAEEIIVNVVNYAYSDESGDLEIDFERDKQIIRFTFKDQGIPFNPLEKSEVDTNLQAHEREIGGLGIHMIKSMTDRVAYDYQNGENILTIEKSFS